MQIVKVRLRKPRRVLSMLCNDVHLDRGDQCVVRSDRGLEWGTCILPPEPCPGDLGRRINDQVVRLANDDDLKTFDILEQEERKARKVCQEKIREHTMDMKLVDVEYTFDKKKIVFYFTAEDRVDFRELVRDLAHDLRTRIELRHIQVRDEAKMVGGIASCGRELCCTSWLDEFRPISMRMAKRQNLSLNPSKISGQCGRLLCCLSYENDQYESMKRRAKPVRSDEPKDERAARPERAEQSERTERPRPKPEPIKEPAKSEAVIDEAPAEAAVGSAVDSTASTNSDSAPTAPEATEDDSSAQPTEPRQGRRRRRRRPREGGS